MRAPAAGTAGGSEAEQNEVSPKSKPPESPRQAAPTEAPAVAVPSLTKREQREQERKALIGSARELEAALVERFTPVFDRARPKPLAIGIHEAIAAAIGDLDRRVLGMFIRYWTWRWPYLKAVAADGSVRHALDGSVVGPVSDEHRQGAADRIRGLKERDRLDPKAAPKPKAAKAPEPTKARVKPRRLRGLLSGMVCCRR
jgi:hypothetical protein